MTERVEFEPSRRFPTYSSRHLLKASKRATWAWFRCSYFGGGGTAASGARPSARATAKPFSRWTNSASSAATLRANILCPLHGGPPDFAVRFRLTDVLEPLEDLLERPSRLVLLVAVRKVRPAHIGIDGFAIKEHDFVLHATTQGVALTGSPVRAEDKS